MNNKIEQFWNCLYNRDITNNNDLIREMIRVKLTQKEIINGKIKKEEIESVDSLYQIMKDTTEEIGYFPGDRDLFKEIYNIGKKIDLQEFAIKTYKNDRIGTIIAPIYLTNYIKNILDKSDAKTVLITEAEKNLVGLKDIISEFKNISFTITSENQLTFFMLKIIFNDFENVEIKHQSIYKRLLIKEKFDLALCLPTFGVKFEADEIRDTYITRMSEGIAVENLLEVIKNTGRLFVIVPARFTFSGGEFERIRKHIKLNYSLESIYTLPEGTFRPYTGIKTYMLEITNKQVSKIKLGHLELKGDKFLIQDQRKVSKDEFNQYSDWRVELFLSENQDELQKFKNSKIPKAKLKDVAEIFRGKSVMKKDIKPGKIHVLNISDIKDGQIIFDTMDTMDEEERKIKRYELNYNDLIITCRGTINKVAVYKSSKKLVIASANVIVIRFKEKIFSEYIKIFMESPVGKTLIKSFQRGTVIMNINSKDIGEMVIPIAPIEKQMQIAAEYSSENELYLEMTKRAEERWNNHKQAIYENILK